MVLSLKTKENESNEDLISTQIIILHYYTDAIAQVVPSNTTLEILKDILKTSKTSTAWSCH